MVRRTRLVLQAPLMPAHPPSRPPQSSAEGTQRVVFVVVRGAPAEAPASSAAAPRTRRKRALGVEDGDTWATFTARVAARLQLRGVGAVYRASTGAALASLDDLVDMEDLEVEETPAPSSAAPAAQQQPLQPGVAAPCVGLPRCESGCVCCCCEKPQRIAHPRARANAARRRGGAGRRRRCGSSRPGPARCGWM